MKPTVEAKNICFNYHSLDGETEAIKDLSFTVEKGEFISIVGPSGCGNALPAKIQMHRKSGALILLNLFDSLGNIVECRYIKKFNFTLIHTSRKVGINGKLCIVRNFKFVSLFLNMALSVNLILLAAVGTLEI